jgi:hypothetical protein
LSRFLPHLISYIRQPNKISINLLHQVTNNVGRQVRIHPTAQVKKRKYGINSTSFHLSFDAIARLHEAFLPFQKFIKHNFVENGDEFIGVEASEVRETPRTVILKHRDGARITFEDRDPLDPDVLHIYWLFPILDRSQHVLVRVTDRSWISFIKASRRASSFIPLDPFIPFHPEMDDVHQLAIRQILGD